MIETTNLKLKKYEDNDVTDPALAFNPNMDIIEQAFSNISTDAKGTKFDNATNGMTSNNVQGAIEENKLSILGLNAKTDSTNTRVATLENNNGVLTNLQTTNKVNLVGAINELFQNANSGKSTIATSVGSPLLATDTFSAMGTKINTLASTLATNLLNKGVSASASEKMSVLINKVASISTFKKIAGGKVNLYNVANFSAPYDNVFQLMGQITIDSKLNVNMFKSVRFKFTASLYSNTNGTYTQLVRKRNGVVIWTSEQYVPKLEATYVFDYNVGTGTGNTTILPGDTFEFWGKAYKTSVYNYYAKISNVTFSYDYEVIE